MEVTGSGSLQSDHETRSSDCMSGANRMDHTVWLSQSWNGIQNTGRNVGDVPLGIGGAESETLIKPNEGIPSPHRISCSYEVNITLGLSEFENEIRNTRSRRGGIPNEMAGTEPGGIVQSNRGTPNPDFISGGNGMERRSRLFESDSRTSSQRWIFGANGIDRSSRQLESENEMEDTGSKLGEAPDGTELPVAEVDIFFVLWNMLENDVEDTGTNLGGVPIEMAGTEPDQLVQFGDGTPNPDLISGTNGMHITPCLSEKGNEIQSTGKNFGGISTRSESNCPGIELSRIPSFHRSSSSREESGMDMTVSLSQRENVTEMCQRDLGGGAAGKETSVSSPGCTNDSNGSEQNSERVRDGLEIEADCHRARNRHPPKAVLSLRDFFDNKTPYPTERQLYQLSKLPHLCGLTIKQINSWFCNERERKRHIGTSNAGISYKTQNNHPEAAIRVLRSWVHAHPGNDRPTKEDKILLAGQAGLTLTKVCYWFENYRKKQRKQALKPETDKPEEMQAPEARQEQGKMEVTEARVHISESEAHQPIGNENLVQEMEYEVEPPEDWDEDLWKSCACSDTP